MILASAGRADWTPIIVVILPAKRFCLNPFKIGCTVLFLYIKSPSWWASVHRLESTIKLGIRTAAVRELVLLDQGFLGVADVIFRR